MKSVKPRARKVVSPPLMMIIIIMTRSDQPEPPVVAIVRQNGLSSVSSRASVTDTPVSRQIW